VRIPPNLFSIPFTLAGLAEAWRAGQPILGVPVAVANAFDIAAAVLLLVIGARYAGQGGRLVAADLTDKTLSPFLALPLITAMLLGVALAVYAFTAGRVVVIVFLVATVLLGGWMTGEWIAAPLDRSTLHPGYFLPTVAGSLIGAFAAAQVHLHTVAEAAFGTGILSWILLGSLLLNRLFLEPTLPVPLIPTMAIEMAPPVVAGAAYSALTGGRLDVVAYTLAGYSVLMALVQIRLARMYFRLRFAPSFWAFGFSYASAFSYGLLWIAARRPPGAVGFAIADLAVITGFIALLAARTVLAIARGDFL